MAAPPLPVELYPMRLWVGEQLLRQEVKPEIRAVLGRGRDASRLAELLLPAGSASNPAAQASRARRCGQLGAGVLATRAREGAEGRKGSGIACSCETGLLVLVEVI